MQLELDISWLELVYLGLGTAVNCFACSEQRHKNILYDLGWSLFMLNEQLVTVPELSFLNLFLYLRDPC
jgi:hypothetical protein